MKPPSFLLSLLLAAAPLAALEIIYSGKDVTRRESPAAEGPVIADYYVVWPAADLRREPREISPDVGRHNPYPVDELQETQVLYGELVQAFEVKNGWVRVEAPEQPEYTHAGRWQGYPGWVPEGALAQRPGLTSPNAMVVARFARLRKSRWPWSGGLDLPMGSRVFAPLERKGWIQVTGLAGDSGWMRSRELVRNSELPKDSEDIRAALLKAAGQFLGEPYFWGGRTGHRKSRRGEPSGVDCSALVNLAYRTVGFDVPRDAHEQFMASRPIKGFQDLRPGDLIFLAKETKPDKMTHVMIFAGGEEIIEAVHEFNKVRRIPMKKKLGRRLADLKPGDHVAGYVVYLGQLIP